MRKKYNLKKLASIGLTANILEFYDFSIYGYLASVIGVLFFKTENKILALILALCIFSMSFIVRPVGSIFFGYLADQYGRKIVLRTTLIITAISTFLIGLLPTDKAFGFLPVILLIILKIIQGFAVGGEVPTNGCYIYEIAPVFKKNFFTSFVPSGGSLGMLLGSFVIFILHSLYSEKQILNFAWRIPFLLGGITAILIFKIRNSITESDDFKPDNLKMGGGVLKLLLAHKVQLAQLFFLVAFVETAFYLLFVWYPLYLKAFLDISPNLAYFVNSCGLLSLVILQTIIGFISKNHQRKKYFITGIIILLTMAYPLFYFINQKRTFLILIAPLIFASSFCWISGVLWATISSLFDSKIRCTAVNLGFTLSTAIFGGLSPTICSFLIYKLHFNLAPVLFLLIVGIIALFAAITLKNK